MERGALKRCRRRRCPRETRVVHGHRRAFVRAPAGSARAAPARHRRHAQTSARHHQPAGRLSHTVIAPDLLGHGKSASRAPTTRSAPRGWLTRPVDELGRAGDRRRPLPRRRNRDAVRLPVPERCGTPRAGGQRRLGPELSLEPARGGGAGQRGGSHRAHPPAAAGCARGCGRWTPSAGPVGSETAPRTSPRPVRRCWRCPKVEARRALLRTLRSVVDARGPPVTAIDRLSR